MAWPRPQLVVLSGDQHDLPPKWDAEPVIWSEWDQAPFTTAQFHGPPDICECGSTDRPVICHGRVRVPGRSSLALRLLAFRCLTCHLDTVWDEKTGHIWTLDVADYGAKGSVDPDGVD